MIDHGQPTGKPSLGDVRAVGRLPLWVGFLAGPTLWSLHLVVSEFLVGAACSSGPAGFNGFTILGATGWRWVLLLVTGFFALLVLAADVVAYRSWQESRIGIEVTGVVGGAAGRSGWLALAGILMSTLFLIGILLAGVPIVWLSGCT